MPYPGQFYPGQFYPSQDAYTPKTGSDLATVTDTSSLYQANAALGMETGFLSESVSIVVTISASEVFSESETRNNTASQVTSDTAITSEQRSTVASTISSDLASLSDSSFIFEGFLKDVTELGTLSESISIYAWQSRSDTATSNETKAPATFWSRTDLDTFTDLQKLNVLGSELFSFSDAVNPRFAYIYSADLLNLLDKQQGNFQYVQSDLAMLSEIAYITPLEVITRDPFDYPDYLLPATVKQRDLRIIAQDHFSREIIHWDLPVDNIQLTFNLSGPNLFSGSLTSEMEQITTLDPPLTPDRTWIHVEENNIIIASFILTTIIDESESQIRQIEAEGFSAYPHWVIYEGASYVGVQVDPSLIIEKLWKHVQSFPDGNLGVQVLNVGTPVRIGYPPNTTNIQSTTGINVEQAQDGPYLLNFWTAINCGEEIEKLCKEAPIEYYELSYWNQYRSDIEHRIVLGYPRVGKRREDLFFREGENLYQLIPSYQQSNENYASDVLVIGAGTGPNSIRAKASGRIGRLRKTKVIQDQNISRNIQAEQIARFEFTRLNESRFLIENVIIDVSHPNALFNDFQVGDDIYIQCSVPYVGYVQKWYRITSMQYDIYNRTASLSIDPSESFSYGHTKVDPISYLPTKGFAIVSSWPIWKGDIPAGGEVVSSANVTDDRLEALKGDAVGRACQKYDVYDIPPGKAYVYEVVGQTVYDRTVNIQDTGDGNYTLILAKTEEGGIFVGDNVFFIDNLGNYFGQRPDKTEQTSEFPYALPSTVIWCTRAIQVWKANPKSIDSGLRFPGYDTIPGATGLYANYTFAKVYYGWGGTYSSDGPGPEFYGIMNALIAGTIWIY